MPDSNAALAASTATPLAAVFAALREHDALPSLGQTLARVTRMLESDTEAVQDLADVILADVTLTQRLLKLANTLPYRAGGGPVTTVTRAIMLLGFNQVRAAVVSLVLLERLLGAGNAERLRADLHRALLAGCLARELLAGAGSEEAEEAAIAATFRSVGRLLVAVYAPAAADAVRAAMQAEALGESAAARRVLERSFDELNDAVLKLWALPERIAAAVQPLPPRPQAPRGATERVRVAAGFGDDVARVVATHGGAARDRALADVLARFASAVTIDRERLTALLEAATARTRDLEQACGLKPIDACAARATEAAPADLRLDAEAVQPSVERDAAGRPANSHEVLLAGLADATEALARGAQPGTVIRIVLETMYSGLGFARTALVARDPATAVFRTRAACGEPRAQFCFPAHGTDLFQAALARATDLLIADTGAEKVRSNLPDWFARDFARTRSFLLMPLMPAGKAVGFLYADRAVVDDRGLDAEELRLLRALRSQVVLAMKTS